MTAYRTRRFDPPRSLSGPEIRLLRLLLAPHFRGVRALREQSLEAAVRETIVDPGAVTVFLDVPGPPAHDIESTLPVSLEASRDGSVVHLYVSSGLLDSFVYAVFGDGEVRQLPSLTAFDTFAIETSTGVSRFEITCCSKDEGWSSS